MSRYSDKKPLPGCRVTGCPQPGTALKVRHGVLGWYCEEHQNK